MASWPVGGVLADDAHTSSPLGNWCPFPSSPQRERPCSHHTLSNFDDICFCTLDKRKHLLRFRLGDMEMCQGCCSVTAERSPIAFADAHAFVHLV